MNEAGWWVGGDEVDHESWLVFGFKGTCPPSPGMLPENSGMYPCLFYHPCHLGEESNKATSSLTSWDTQSGGESKVDM